MTLGEAQCCFVGREIERRIGEAFDCFAGDRMRKAQELRMQTETIAYVSPAPTAIHWIADDRMTDRSEVYTDLVGSARFEAKCQFGRATI